VLIIDDKKENIEVVSFFLETYNIEYTWIPQGTQGLEVIKKEGPRLDLILLDLALPGISGSDIFNILYDEGTIQSLNVVLFTASSIPQEEIDRMLNSGAKGVIYKPLSLEDLEEMLEKYLK
jgi:two-component system, chemotaxis family, CheB/CheR fusion protein